MSYVKTEWDNGDIITAEKLNNAEIGIEEINMSYEKQTWSNGEVITAEKLNHIEDGIANKTNVIHIKQDDLIHIGIPNALTNSVDGTNAIRYDVSNIDEIIGAALYLEFRDSIIRATGIEQAHIPNVNPSDVDEGNEYISNVDVFYFYSVDMEDSLAIIPTDAVIQIGTKTGHGA